MNKTAIVTGAAGFLGTALVKELVMVGYRVFAVVRPGSPHNERLRDDANINVVENDILNVGRLPKMIPTTYEGAVFFHIAWGGDSRYDYSSQVKNINYVVEAVRTAERLGCTRFVATGSQAEYGATESVQNEALTPHPFCDYGASKVAACVLSKRVAMERGIDWIWGRVFSLYGKYEPKGRMLRDTVEKMQNGEDIFLSSCRQNWDYLDVCDGARALIALAEKGHSGEIYNIANGKYRPLREYIEDARKYYCSNSDIFYGDDPFPFVSLQPDISKLKTHTGWKPKASFEDGLTGYGDMRNLCLKKSVF